jgi:anti-sigma factor RsiW
MKTHLSIGEIKRYQDQEAGTDERQRIEAHLEACPICQDRAEALIRQAMRNDELLSGLLPEGPSKQISIKAARARLAQRLSQAEKENQLMWNKLTSRISRPAWITLAVVAVLAVALSFPSVRAIATSFLGLFRVEQIQAVPVDFESLSGQYGSASQFEKILSDQVQVEKTGEPQEAASAAEAGALAGIAVRLPAALSGTPTLVVQPGEQVTFTVDYELVKTVLSEIGRSDIQLPKALDGAKVELEVKSAVAAMYGECPDWRGPEKSGEPVATEPVEGSDAPHFKAPRDCTTLLQMPSPTISAPPGLDVSQIGEAYLEILGMSREEAASFASNVDWTTTFVIPIPQRANYQQVTVDGVSGTLIGYHEGGANMYALLWVKDGVLYALSGPGQNSEALDIAGSLQ